MPLTPPRFLDGAARGLRWLRYAIRPPELIVVHHRDYSRAAPAGLMDPDRADKILAFLTDEGVLRRRDVVRPRPASLEHILRVHTAAYVESLADPKVVSEIVGMTLGAREAQDAVDLFRLMVGGTIQATRLALRTGKVTLHLGGGLHHATPDRGMGFCAFNDIAVAVRRLRERGFHERVLVVDLDLHDGNGTRAAFADDESVHTFSIHNAAWDDGDAVESTSIAMGSGVTDEALLSMLGRKLPPVIERFRPGLVVYVAGADTAATDALGDWRLSERGILQRDRFVVEQARGAGAVPLVVLMAGGYGSSAWRYSARFAAWLATGSALEPPDEADMIMERFRRISSEWDRGRRRGGEDDWGLSAEDVYGTIVHHDTRFLNRYSRHEVELQLEQLGLLDRIRVRGHRGLSVTVDASPPLGQIVRVHGGDDHATPLMELKAGRSRSVLPEAEVIEVEWLLLQNPRASFTARRDQLPGQRYPGLGMLRDVVAWLVLTCERLGLDGITFAPGQYYMAALGTRVLRFVRPEAQARFEGMRVALAGLDLAEANRAVNQGRVVEAKTGAPVAWVPETMVLPVSRKLQERLQSREYREAVHRAAVEMAFIVVGAGRQS